MTAPVDYPISDDSPQADFSGCELAYAVHLDRISEKEVFAQRALLAKPIIVDVPRTSTEPKRATPKRIADLAHSLLSEGFSSRRAHRATHSSPSGHSAP